MISEDGRKNGKSAKPQWADRLSYAQKQRLRYFESRLIWEGQVNRRSVCEQFGVTANHFTRDLGDYKRHLPYNIWYDVSSRAYRPTPKFNAQFTSGDPEEYLALLRLYSHNRSPALMAELGVYVSSDATLEPQERINRQALQEVLKAIREKHGLTISYQSFTRENPATRTIWPHALAWSGDRWHARVYDEKRSEYIDIALARITEVIRSGQPAIEDLEDDVDWLEQAVVEVIPNPDLSLPQQTAIAMEYGMDKVDGSYVWPVRMRRCLIPYFLYRYRLDMPTPDRKRHGFPTQRVIVRNPDIVSEFAFPSD